MARTQPARQDGLRDGRQRRCRSRKIAPPGRENFHLVNPLLLNRSEVSIRGVRPAVTFVHSLGENSLQRNSFLFQ